MKKIVTTGIGILGFILMNNALSWRLLNADYVEWRFDYVDFIPNTTDCNTEGTYHHILPQTYIEYPPIPPYTGYKCLKITRNGEPSDYVFFNATEQCKLTIINRIIENNGLC